MIECPYCHGDGGDPYCDYVLPCPECGGLGEIDALPDDDDDDGGAQKQGDSDDNQD